MSGRARAYLIIAVSAGLPLVIGTADTSTDRKAGTPPTVSVQDDARPDGSHPPTDTAPVAIPYTVPIVAGSSGLPTTGVPPNTPEATGTGAATRGPGAVAPIPGPAQSSGPSRATDQKGGGATTLSLEAEGPAADWTGPTRKRKLAGASGGMVVSNPNEVTAHQGTSVVFGDVRVPEAGQYTITFHYVSPEPRVAVVSVNGSGPTSLSFPATGDGGTAIGTLSISTGLTAGANTVEYGNPSAPMPDLDRIVVTR